MSVAHIRRSIAQALRSVGYLLWASCCIARRSSAVLPSTASQLQYCQTRARLYWPKLAVLTKLPLVWSGTAYARYTQPGTERGAWYHEQYARLVAP
eukprot:2343200-Rhodomonas_salina.1